MFHLHSDIPTTLTDLGIEHNPGTASDVSPSLGHRLSFARIYFRTPRFNDRRKQFRSTVAPQADRI